MRLPIVQLNAVVPPLADARYYLRRIPCTRRPCRICDRFGGHGPYWYARWRVGSHIRQQFLGRHRPESMSDDAVEQAMVRYRVRQRQRGKSDELLPETGCMLSCSTHVCGERAG